MVFGKRRVGQLLSLIATISVGLPMKAAFAFGFVPPPDNETPRQTSAGGAARGNFCAGNSSVAHTVPNAVPNAWGIALTGARPSIIPEETMPVNMPVAMPVAILPEGNYGKTLKSHPTFLIYVPPSDVDELLFVLKDEADNLLYSQDVSLINPSGPNPNPSGIISITLPEDAPSLAVNHNYRWQVAFKCNGLISPNSHFIQGWVERAETPMSLTAGLTTGSAETAFDQAESLSNAGIWYDSVSTLATLVYTDAENSGAQSNQASSTMLESWEEFLTSVGLESFSAVPVVRP